MNVTLADYFCALITPPEGFLISKSKVGKICLVKRSAAFSLIN